MWLHLVGLVKESNPNLINIVGSINNSVWRLLLQNTNRSSRRIKIYIPPPFSCIRKGTQSYACKYVGTSFAKSIPCVFLPPRVSSITIIIIIYRGGALRAGHEKNENICICFYIGCHKGGGFRATVFLSISNLFLLFTLSPRVLSSANSAIN